MRISDWSSDVCSSDLASSAPASRAARPARRNASSAARSALAGLQCGECRQLFLRRLALVLRLPLRERLAVDRLARFVPRHHQAAGLHRLAVPVGEAVAAEAGADHQVDVRSEEQPYELQSIMRTS